jgi:hypothetical protein
MILSVVHAFRSRSFVLVRPGRANLYSTAHLCQRHRVVLINQLHEDKPS